MKFSSIILSTLAITSSASAAALPAPIAIPNELSNTCSTNQYSYCCDFIQPGLLNLDLLVSLCSILGLSVGLDLNLSIGTQCVVTENGRCSGSKKHKCCTHTAQHPTYGTCGY